MENNLKVLPCGIQDFEKIRTGNYLYIDKTDIVYQLASDMAGECFFLGRPRRFGKSLFLSTLEYYYLGRKDLFEGLKIMELEKEWKTYEVLRFDFSGCYNLKTFNDKLNNKLSYYEEKYGYARRDEGNGTRLSTLLRKASKEERQKIVLLFDEYDSALQSTLYNDEEHEKIRDEYRSFFAVLKEETYYIKKIVLTGIMKFTQLSLFSVLNNVRIISANDKYASVCGFTHEELRNDFRPYVERLAEANGISFEKAYSQIIELYDGYCFSKSLTKVINPFSLLNALEENKLGSYWSSSGATKYIMDNIDNGMHKMPRWDNETVDINDLESNDADKKNLVLSLYQTGYLTIKGVDKEAEEYILGIPNSEVKVAVSKHIVPRMLNVEEDEVMSAVKAIKKKFILGDLETAMENIKSLVAQTPYSQEKDKKGIEDRFQFILTHILWLCGFTVLNEVRTANGRIDILCKTKRRNAIFELKMASNGGLESASEQIEERLYALPFLNDEKELSTIAVEFDAEQKLLTRWEIKRVK